MRKKLSVCIPTYNRANYIQKQLQFFGNELATFPDIDNSVSFIVSDNASTDNSASVVKRIQESNPFFKFHQNQTNAGLVGNIITCLNLSDTEYVWFVSDDDHLKPGIVQEILNIIDNSQGPAFIYLNYTSCNRKGFNGVTGYRDDAKEAALEIFDEAYGSLVFMTSCVHKRKNLLELKHHPMFELISAPMLYSFYSCTKGPIYINEESYITFHSGNASYAGLKNILRIKFEEYIRILELLPSLGFDSATVKLSIQNFFATQSHAHLLYFLINPIESLKLYKYYNFRTIVSFQRNVNAYIKRRLIDWARHQ